MTLQTLWERWAGVPFAWGKFDCAILAATWMDSRTGSTHETWLRSLGYTSGREAWRLVKAAGGLGKGTIARLGPLKPLSELQPGDLVLLRALNSPAVELLGILTPQQVLTPGKTGLMAVPLDTVIGGWPCRRR